MVRVGTPCWERGEPGSNPPRSAWASCLTCEPIIPGGTHRLPVCGCGSLFSDSEDSRASAQGRMVRASGTCRLLLWLQLPPRCLAHLFLPPAIPCRGRHTGSLWAWSPFPAEGVELASLLSELSTPDAPCACHRLSYILSTLLPPTSKTQKCQASVWLTLLMPWGEIVLNGLKFIPIHTCLVRPSQKPSWGCFPKEQESSLFQRA